MNQLVSWSLQFLLLCDISIFITFVTEYKKKKQNVASLLILTTTSLSHWSSCFLFSNSFSLSFLKNTIKLSLTHNKQLNFTWKTVSAVHFTALHIKLLNCPFLSKQNNKIVVCFVFDRKGPLFCFDRWKWKLKEIWVVWLWLVREELKVEGGMWIWEGYIAFSYWVGRPPGLFTWWPNNFTWWRGLKAKGLPK